VIDEHSEPRKEEKTLHQRSYSCYLNNNLHDLGPPRDEVTPKSPLEKIREKRSLSKIRSRNSRLSRNNSDFDGSFIPGSSMRKEE
jgi:hypothetical protein